MRATWRSPPTSGPRALVPGPIWTRQPGRFPDNRT